MGGAARRRVLYTDTVAGTDPKVGFVVVVVIDDVTVSVRSRAVTSHVSAENAVMRWAIETQ